MLHHIEIYVSDLSVTRSFWTGLLAQIGYRESAAWDDGFTLTDERDAYLTFVRVQRRHASREYHRCTVGLNHLAFKVDGRAKVDALRQYCRDNHVPCLYDDRYPFANGGDEYYALFVEGPDRMKLEFVAS